MLSRPKLISFSDLHREAKKRLPKILFDVIESGVENEHLLARNEAAFKDHLLTPRLLVDVGVRTQQTTIFGKQYAAPIGIAPTGLAGMFRAGAESMLARAAVQTDVPFILSGACIEELEKVSAISPDRTWFQLYAARDRAVTEDLLTRTRDAGIETLVLTVDTPVLPKRERDMRNGFGLPLKPPLPLMLEALAHPAWIAHYLLNGGLPLMKTWARYAPKDAGAGEVFTYFRSQSPSIQTWKDLDFFRSRWDGNLVLKGIQHPADAIRAAEAGVDGVIVSNHGAKAMDQGPAAITCLPAVVQAVGSRVVVMMDSGIRRGADVVVARCLGAQFVFSGRGPLYGVIARGVEGAASCIEIFKDEIDRTLGLIGCPDARLLSTEYLSK
ncbi:MAG: alpha-hydroxy-acid oxidizing protein [Polaromonas sp.]|uniref:alpha-hydroxy acid oxidase n=1 Tax=Polaromonas sp. TaxID=1869339 RepID=UPI0025CF020C|nr:alpha-hydroxy acid oxidase [Polaromonas sp.]MBI2726328.1 alpha-hydroxy-acid oxidizing protein [Polaromonas sp.]